MKDNTKKHEIKCKKQQMRKLKHKMREIKEHATNKKNLQQNETK